VDKVVTTPRSMPSDQAGQYLPTSLDPTETNVELGWERRHPFPHVHAQHADERHRIIRMFATSSSTSLINRAWKLRECCANPTIRPVSYTHLTLPTKRIV